MRAEGFPWLSVIRMGNGCAASVVPRKTSDRHKWGGSGRYYLCLCFALAWSLAVAWETIASGTIYFLCFCFTFALKSLAVARETIASGTK